MCEPRSRLVVQMETELLRGTAPGTGCDNKRWERWADSVINCENSGGGCKEKRAVSRWLVCQFCGVTDGVYALYSLYQSFLKVFFFYFKSLKGAIEGPFTSSCPLDGPQKENFIMFSHHVPNCEKIWRQNIEERSNYLQFWESVALDVTVFVMQRPTWVNLQIWWFMLPSAHCEGHHLWSAKVIFHLNIIHIIVLCCAFSSHTPCFYIWN